MTMESTQAQNIATLNAPSPMSSNTMLESTHTTFTVPERPPEASATKPMENDVGQPSKMKRRPRSKPAHSKPTTAANISTSTSTDCTPQTIQAGTKSEETENKTTPKHKSRPNNNRKGAQWPPMKEQDMELRAEVSGYPTYTKPQDLQKILSKYGNAAVEHVGRKFAVIRFTSKELVAAAIQDSLQLCLYGQFLAVKPFTGVYDEHKKQVFKSKHAVLVVEPTKIPLDGSFSAQLGALLAAVRLTQAEVASLAALYGDLERALHACWPGCQAMPFGSITTGLGVKSSDADCFMNIPPQFRYGSYNFVNKAKRILQQYPDVFTEVFAIPRANTPIVKLFHLPTRTHCDLTFKTPLGALNSKLIAFLLHADPRFLPLAVVVKYWASVHGLSGSGKLTNYALTLLLIFFLQSRGLLPSVAWLQKDAAPVMVDGWNTAFVASYDRLSRPPDQTSIEELLGEFFKYYDTFDFKNLVVCPLLGRTIDKIHFVENTLPSEFQRYQRHVADNLVAPLRTKASMCVQDPFELCHNVASSVTPRLAEDIQIYFRFAAEFYEKDKATGCMKFLRTILLKKPKLPRVKSTNNFRLCIHPKILESIIQDDWQRTIRKAIFIILEDMLKLKLVPDGEIETSANGREKEKYLMRLEKPVWKRKKFMRLYDVVKMDFVGKQVRITEEILNVEHSEWDISVRFTLSYSTKIYSSWVSVKYIKGNLDAFQNFGKFFVANIQHWVIGVLHTNGETSMRSDCYELGAFDASGHHSDCDSDSVDNEGATKGKEIDSEEAPNDAMQASDVETEVTAEANNSISDEGLKESEDTSASELD